MKSSRMPRCGRPEDDDWCEQQFGRQPPDHPLPGRRPGDIPGRLGLRAYDSEEEDDDRPRFLGTRLIDPRHGGQPGFPPRHTGMSLRSPGAMSEYGGRHGYSSEDEEGDEYPMNRLGAFLNQVRLGGRDPYDYDDPPPPRRLGDGPERGDRRGSDGEGEYCNKGRRDRPVRPPRDGLRGPDGPEEFIPPGMRRLPQREEPRFRPWGISGNRPIGGWPNDDENDELDRTDRLSGIEFLRSIRTPGTGTSRW
ncbi:uncharacterized protein M421DRAFT_393246, partial [Didymella exigua CBS 183.55]